MTGEELIALRKKAGLRAFELAEILGYRPQRWSAFERNRAPVPKVVQYAARWVCENRLATTDYSLTASEQAINALMERLVHRQREEKDIN